MGVRPCSFKVSESSSAQAHGASTVPKPGFNIFKVSVTGLKDSNPGNLRRIGTVPGGTSNCNCRSGFPDRAASSLKVLPRRNADDTSADHTLQPLVAAIEHIRRCPQRELVPAKVSREDIWRSLNPRTVKRARTCLTPSIIFHFNTQRESILLTASHFLERSKQFKPCHLDSSPNIAVWTAGSCFRISSGVRMFMSRSITVLT